MAAVAHSSSVCTGSASSRRWVTGCLVWFSSSRPGDFIVPGNMHCMFTSNGAGACPSCFVDLLAPLYSSISDLRESHNARSAVFAGPYGA